MRWLIEPDGTGYYGVLTIGPSGLIDAGPEEDVVVVPETEVERLREWINTVGRTCPSNSTIDTFLNAPEGPSEPI